MYIQTYKRIFVYVCVYIHIPLSKKKKDRRNYASLLVDFFQAMTFSLRSKG